MMRTELERAKKEITAISVVKRIQKCFAVGVAIFAFVAGFVLIRRFEFIDVSVDLPQEGISAGSYLLIDWDYRQGRDLVVGDRILYCAKKSKVRLGRIVVIGNKKNESLGNFYLIASTTKKKLFWLEKHRIRGRVLMVLAKTLPLQPKNFAD